MEYSKITALPAIACGTVPNVLLVGNGINRAFGDDSLERIIEGRAQKYGVPYKKSIYDRMPFNMRIVAATQDHVNEEMKEMAAEMLATEMSREQITFVRKMAAIPCEAILTLNYSYEIERSISPKASPQLYRSRYRYAKRPEQRNDRMIYQYVSMEYQGRPKNIWHVHGMASAPNTMIIGHYFYGKLLTKIQQHVGSLMRRYNGCKMHGSAFVPQSWIDYFLIGNVYVFGFGFDLAETDLWWLACCKKRNFPDTRIIFYEPAASIQPQKEIMMQANGFIVRKGTLGKGGYMQYYERVLREMYRKCRE